MDLETIPCPSCGGPLEARFCPQCGEKRIGPDDLRLSRFLHEVFHFETHLDNTVVQTLKALVARPGFLTLAWVRGQRVAFAKPLQLFVLLNLVFFLVAPKLGLFRWDLAEALRFDPRGALAAKVEALRLAKGLDLPAFLTLYGRVQSGYIRGLFLALIPCLALALKAFHPRRRVVEHLVFAINYTTYVFLLFLAVFLFLAAVALPFHTGFGDRVIGPLAFLGMAAYLAPALKRVFAAGTFRSLGEACLLALLFLPMLVLYQRFTVWITFRSILNS